VKVTVKVTGGKKVYQSMVKLGESIDTIVNADIEKQMNAAMKELQRPGKHITYPVKWDSERQRRAFFATDGFGAGIPYKRTGRYSKSFKVVKTGKGARRSYALINTWPKAKYVGGDARAQRQSRIHAGRWPLVADTVRKFAQRLVKSKPQTTNKIRNLIRSLGLGL
jgi:hypothetical protein